jgi:hypothetical protein
MAARVTGSLTANRSQLYELAKRKSIQGRSKMGKWELIDALRKAG